MMIFEAGTMISASTMGKCDSTLLFVDSVCTNNVGLCLVCAFFVSKNVFK